VLPQQPFVTGGAARLRGLMAVEDSDSRHALGQSGEAAARHVRPGFKLLRSCAAAGAIGGPSAAGAAASGGGIGAPRPAVAQGTHRAAGFRSTSAAGGGI